MGSGASCLSLQSESPKVAKKDAKIATADEKKVLKSNEAVMVSIVAEPDEAGSASSGNKIALAPKETTPNSQTTSDATTISSDAGAVPNPAPAASTANTTNDAPIEANESNDSQASDAPAAAGSDKSEPAPHAPPAAQQAAPQQSAQATQDSQAPEEAAVEASEYKFDAEQEKLYVTSMKNLEELNHYAPISGLAERTVYKQHAKSAKEKGSGTGNKGNFKKVLKEIQTALPENITVSWNGSMFVRYDEDMPQFLQCVLVGLLDTPYANGIFLFDIYLDSSYPDVACKIQHVTKGATLVTANNGPGGFSPNLHKSTGKVCLSLLGTWDEGARWDKDKSNVYQVLSTILFMIFGSKYPYYNEPGHGFWEGTAPQKDHDQKVIDYNEELYHGTLKYGILDVLKNPYKGFESVIKTHFKLKKDEILDCVENKWIAKGSEQSKQKLNPLLVELKQEFEKLK